MNAKVLVIDDEESIRFTFETFLTEEGFSVTTADGFEAALARISEITFDIIFADIILGDRSGIDLLREIRGRFIKCPVIMITGYPNVETASEALRMGAFDYIPKPVRQEMLVRTAHMALKHKALQEEKEKYRLNLEATFRSIKDAIVTVDQDLVVIEVNDAARSICGINRNAIDKPFNILPTNCTGNCIKALRDTIALRKSVELQRMECRHNKHIKQVVTVNTSPLIAGPGEFSGAVMIIRDETRLNELERSFGERQHFQNIIGQNNRMQKIYRLIEDLADVQTTVLITGESGTGKELVAEAIHYTGKRSSQHLVKVNCSALPETLLESELFGHVKGAFTGADRDKVGRFERADGGTIFLDEIGDIPAGMQLKLLRVLQEKIIERVGDSIPIKVDVRIIAATNQDLYRKVKQGRFREDLYYRLKVVELFLPPLRERTDDIPSLIRHSLQKLNNKLNKTIDAVSGDVQKIFMDYPWPGNIREMENALEHAVIVCHQNTITMEHLPQNLRNLYNDKIPVLPSEDEIGPEALLRALEKTGWNKAKAARLLGVNVRTIYRKIDKFNIVTERLK